MNEEKLKKDKSATKTFNPFNIGLPNFNNTCYINSIISCLLQLEQFMLSFGASRFKAYLEE